MPVAFLKDCSSASLYYRCKGSTYPPVSSLSAYFTSFHSKHQPFPVQPLSVLVIEVKLVLTYFEILEELCHEYCDNVIR